MPSRPPPSTPKALVTRYIPRHDPFDLDRFPALLPEHVTTCRVDAGWEWSVAVQYDDGTLATMSEHGIAVARPEADGRTGCHYGTHQEIIPGLTAKEFQNGVYAIVATILGR